MAESLTIDSSSLIKSSNSFAESMVAFLDTEMEYIQYLREGNGGGIGVGGIGGSTMGGGPTFTDDAPAPKKKGKGVYIPRLRRRTKPNIRPRNRIRIGDKLKNFKLLRRARDITRQLTKLNLRGNQIELYKQLRNSGKYTMQEALDMARRSNPGGNFIKNSWKAFTDMIPNRPKWMTRINMGNPNAKNFFQRGLTPGNISETAAAIKYNVIDTVKTQGDNVLSGAKNLLKPAITKVDDLTKGLITNADELMKAAMPAFKNFYKVGAGKVIKKIPFGIGALIDFVILTTIFKEDPGRAAFRAAGSTLGAWLGGVAGTAGGAAIGGIGAVIGGPAGAIAGSMLGDWLGGMIFDKTMGKDTEQEGGTTDVVAEGEGTKKFKEGGVGIAGGANGSVITAPTRGLFGGGRALVGEANEAEIILPMSKIGDAISAVYREGASVMVGATIAFLGPLAGGNPAAAAVLAEARRIGSITGADTDIEPNTVELPDMQTPTEETNSSSASVELTSNVTKTATGGEDNSKINTTTSVAGTNRWKTILPQGDPLFSSPFGPRWGRMHRGIDIGVWENSPVHAQEDGVVEQILPKFGEYGGAVVVVHKDGTANLYGHVHEYVVKKGQKVKRGDQLAKIQYYPGKDGSNQSHLHFERFNKSGTRIDPLPYFSQGGAHTPPEKEETKMKSVNQGGPNLRNISSNFVNLGSTVKNRNKSLIDTPVNITKSTTESMSPQMIPVPQPYPVPVVKHVPTPIEETKKEQRMLISVFGKGATRT